jgi:predicted GNAT family N-acyltransferase
MGLGRLAVATEYQNQQLGSKLLKDALRVLNVAKVAGIRAVLLHAQSDQANAFHLRHGLVESPLDSMTLIVSLSDVRRELRKAAVSG